VRLGTNVVRGGTMKPKPTDTMFGTEIRSRSFLEGVGCRYVFRGEQIVVIATTQEAVGQVGRALFPGCTPDLKMLKPAIVLPGDLAVFAGKGKKS
jgi:hypothetical protein